MKNWATKLVGSAVCLVLLAASADAHLIRFSATIPDLLPGIDANGNVDFGDTADASVKATINTRVPRVLVQARGKVNNFSRRGFKAEDSFVGFVAGPFTVISDVYTVSPKGSASFVARAYVI